MKRRGFTLLELLVVLSILGVVSTIGVTMLFRIMDHWDRTTRTMALELLAGDALNAIREDCARTLSSKSSGGEFKYSRGQAEYEYPFGTVRCDNDQMALPVTERNLRSREWIRDGITYSVDWNGGKMPRLRRTRTEGNSSWHQTVAEGVIGMRIERYDGTEWVTGSMQTSRHWTEENGMIAMSLESRDAKMPVDGPMVTPLPKMLRVSLTLMDPARPDITVTRTATFNLHVN